MRIIMNLKSEENWILAGKAAKCQINRTDEGRDMIVAFENGSSFYVRENKSGSITVWEADG